MATEKTEKLEDLSIEQLEVLSGEIDKQHQELLKRRQSINEMLAARQEQLRQTFRNPLGTASLGARPKK